MNLSKKEVRISTIISEVNHLLSFKLGVYEIADWAKQINRIAPDIDPKVLRFLMDAFATEAIPYDHTKGIQNIFNGLKRVEQSEKGYRIKSEKQWL